MIKTAIIEYSVMDNIETILKKWFNDNNYDEIIRIVRTTFNTVVIIYKI